MGWTLLLFLLRITYCLQLILSTFKALKPVIRRRRTAANASRPLTMNTADRNRRKSLKSQLMNWIVFITYSAAEHALERSKLHILIPLYEEMKLGLTISMLVWGVSGAEIIFTKFLKPLISPYESIFDWIGNLVFELESIVMWAILIIPKWCLRKWNGTEFQEEEDPTLPIRESPKFKSMLKSPAPARIFAQVVELETTQVRLQSNESRSSSLAQFRSKSTVSTDLEAVNTTAASKRASRARAELPEPISAPLYPVLGGVVPDARSESVMQAPKVKSRLRVSKVEVKQVEKEIEIEMEIEEEMMEIDLNEDVEMVFEEELPLPPPIISTKRVVSAKQRSNPRAKPTPIVPTPVLASPPRLAPAPIVEATPAPPGALPKSIPIAEVEIARAPLPTSNSPVRASTQGMPATPAPPGHFAFPRLDSPPPTNNPIIIDSPKMKAHRAISELGRSSAGFEFFGKRAQEAMEKRKSMKNELEMREKISPKKIVRTNSMLSVKSTIGKREGKVSLSGGVNSGKAKAVVVKEVKKRVVKKVQQEVISSEEDSEEEQDRVYKKPIKKPISASTSTSTSTAKRALSPSTSSRIIVEPKKTTRVKTISQKVKPIRITEVDELESEEEEIVKPKQRATRASRAGR